MGYDKMGQVEISCIFGCECPPHNYNMHQQDGDRTSTTKLIPIAVRRSAECQIQIRVTENSTSGEHKVKLSLVGVDVDVRANSAEDWENAGGDHIMYDFRDR